MIQKDITKGKSVKEIRAREKANKEAELKQKCEALAIEKFGEDQIKKWESEFKGLFYLPILDRLGENIEALAVMRPITRQILSYASTKLTDEGLYEFLEAAMRECWVAGDDAILEDDEYFIPAANTFNKIMDGKKANFLKR